MVAVVAAAVAVITQYTAKLKKYSCIFIFINHNKGKTPTYHTFIVATICSEELKRQREREGEFIVWLCVTSGNTYNISVL